MYNIYKTEKLYNNSLAQYRHRENSKMFMNNFNFNFKLCEMKILQLFILFLFAVCEKFYFSGGGIGWNDESEVE